MKNVIKEMGIVTGQPTPGKPQDQNSINNEITRLSNVVNAAKKAGQKVDPSVDQTLIKLKQAAALAAKKAADAAKQTADQAQRVASGTGSVQIPGQADEELNSEGLNNSMANKKLSPRQKKLAAAAAPHNKITGADFKALKKENTDIVGFLKSITQKKYAQADKYLQSVVDSKLKISINRAIENSK